MERLLRPMWWLNLPTTTKENEWVSLKARVTNPWDLRRMKVNSRVPKDISLCVAIMAIFQGIVGSRGATIMSLR